MRRAERFTSPEAYHDRPAERGDFSARHCPMERPGRIRHRANSIELEDRACGSPAPASAALLGVWRLHAAVDHLAGSGMRHAIGRIGQRVLACALRLFLWNDLLGSAVVTTDRPRRKTSP